MRRFYDVRLTSATCKSGPAIQWFLTVVERVVIVYKKIVFVFSCVLMAACETSLNEDSKPMDAAKTGDFGWYFKLSPIDITATLDSNEVTIWHGRQGSIPYSTEAECISAGKKSRAYIGNAWNYKIECLEQYHPSQMPIKTIDVGKLEIVGDR